MNMKRLYFLVLASAFVGAPLATAGSLTATEEPTIKSLTPAEVASGALTPQVHNGLHFVSGGIGIEERAWLASHAREYNTHLTFAVVPGGEFVADVPVHIRDAQGREVLATTSNGPKLLVQLPAGTYEIEATYDGQTVRRTFSVTPQRIVRVGISFRQ